ncbi:contractile injection system tape measure protein [Aequorivita antarctica]|uniref:contractile injection system tape measure protein n=1 Tax=Aequorivita antarctica TaxID=153266 RepID=UPI000DBC1E7B|nr:contractile injection system tape measure protein [Aequorivita antarctica]SRX73811.1 hypothetical protein AEQU3_01246 [Aequorivita antarctica]
MKQEQSSIYKSIFNFNYENKALASRCNNVIETVFDSQIHAALENAISCKIPNEISIELDILEIDIGTISEKELESELPKRIEIAFQQALDTKLNLKNNNLQEMEDEIYINNSGLIIVWPFLPRFFEQLDMLENGEFINSENRNRGVYLIQQLVYNQIDFPEHELVLNKLLVGMPIEDQLEPITELTQQEKDLAESLLNGLIQNWDKIKNTTIEGVQETFLQRNGILKIEEDRSKLRVEQTGVDVLMQTIPWNISLIKLPWMENPLYIDWV